MAVEWGNDSATWLCHGGSVRHGTGTRRDKEGMGLSSSGGKADARHKVSSGDRRQECRPETNPRHEKEGGSTAKGGIED
jgi:hypothetical protein